MASGGAEELLRQTKCPSGFGERSQPVDGFYSSWRDESSNGAEFALKKAADESAGKRVQLGREFRPLAWNESSFSRNYPWRRRGIA